MTLRIFAQLLPDTPYNGIFPGGRVPLVSDVVIGAGDNHSHIEPCFLVDASRLDEGQIQAMIHLLLEKHKEQEDELTRPAAEEYIGKFCRCRPTGLNLSNRPTPCSQVFLWRKNDD
jgi:hypothetical protein